jgi:uncharacterized protein YyaL (SSP411 family)
MTPSDRGFLFSYMHTNRLKNESSPYLLQHAHNPVEWYPWGEEAIEKAKNEDKPILVSIGYAACHWCHVMERESFEDEQTAVLMNEHFINIKVDREERPDVDHIYMDAVQAMTGSGGWPLNVFLTPDLKPFYGGTYFPPKRAYNRMSWAEVLTAVYRTFKEKRTDIESQAENLTEHIAHANTFINVSEDVFQREDLLKMSTNIHAQADTAWGGFGNAPKFPHTYVIQYLLRDYHFFNNKLSLDQALLSLDKLIQGGIYDHLAGGFARYSTDEKWLAPHFEKMLYDNALIVETLCEAYQITKKETYKEVILQTFNFIKEEMMSEEFGFYSAYDADSEGVEGKYYTWSKKEIDELLKEDSKLFCDVYDISEEGNWEETNIIWLPETLESKATEHGITLPELQNKLKENKELLLKERLKRIKPLLDDKQLLNWNALMNTCCSKIYAAVQMSEAKDLAVKNMEFIESRFLAQEVKHTYKNGEAKISGFLDDHAYLIRAYLFLQEITGQFEYLQSAERLTQEVIENFSDDEQLMFFFTSVKQKDIIVRKKEVYDGATPSANSVMAENLRNLSKLLNKPDWLLRSDKMLQSLKKAIVNYPTSFGYWGKLSLENYFGIDEVATLGTEVESFVKEYLSIYHPNRIFQFSSTETVDYPLLKGKNVALNPIAYVCKAYSCKHPVGTINDLRLLISPNELNLR